MSNNYKEREILKKAVGAKGGAEVKNIVSEKERIAPNRKVATITSFPSIMGGGQAAKKAAEIVKPATKLPSSGWQGTVKGSVPSRAIPNQKPMETSIPMNSKNTVKPLNLPKLMPLKKFTPSIKTRKTDTIKNALKNIA